MVISWCIAECVRYAYYFFNLAGGVPSIVNWLRYTLFFVLYPTGAGSEVLMMYVSLPYAKAWNEYYYYLLIVLMLVYIPGKCWGEWYSWLHVLFLFICHCRSPNYVWPYDWTEKEVPQSTKGEEDTVIVIHRERKCCHIFGKIRYSNLIYFNSESNMNGHAWQSNILLSPKYNCLARRRHWSSNLFIMHLLSTMVCHFCLVFIFVIAFLSWCSWWPCIAVILLRSGRWVLHFRLLTIP